MTSNAGALLLRETDRGIAHVPAGRSLFQRWPQAGPDRARLGDAGFSAHPWPSPWLRGSNDHDELRHDPVLGLLSGKLEARRGACAVLAGKSTLNRLEHAPRTDEDHYRKLSVDEDAMKRLFVSLFLKGQPTPPKRIILDLDATTIPSMAIRKAGSSTAITNATAICRFTFSAAGSCFWRNFGPQTSTPRRAPGKRSP